MVSRNASTTCARSSTSAGDIAMGPSSIIEAIAQARKAAQSMAADLAGRPTVELAGR